MSIDKLNSAGIIATSFNKDEKSKIKEEKKDWFASSMVLEFYSSKTKEIEKLAAQKGTAKERTAAAKQLFSNIEHIVINTANKKRS